MESELFRNSSNLFKDEFFDFAPHIDETPFDESVHIPPIIPPSSQSLDPPSSSLGGGGGNIDWDQDVLLSNAGLPELNPLLEMGESVEEDFQKMLNEWENTLGSIQDANEAPSPNDENLNDLESSLVEDFHMSTTPSSHQSPNSLSMSAKSVVVKATEIPSPNKKALAGIVISSGPGGHFETYEGEQDTNVVVTPKLDNVVIPDFFNDFVVNFNHPHDQNTKEVLEANESELMLNDFDSQEEALTPTSGNDPNRASQIIAAVQNHFAGSARNLASQGKVPRIIPSQRIKDALPKEIIDKIKASSTRSKTIAIIEPVPSSSKSSSSSSTASSNNNNLSTSTKVTSAVRASGIASRFKEAASTLNRNKMRQLGICPSPQQVQVSLDHDYCSPSRPKRGRFNNNASNMGSPVIKSKRNNSLLIENSSKKTETVRRDSADQRKDSGLESGEVSDASDTSSSSLYSKLPPYLTTISVKNADSRCVTPQEETGYDRLPAYVKGVSSKSVLKSESVLKQKTIKINNNIKNNPSKSSEESPGISDDICDNYKSGAAQSTTINNSNGNNASQPPRQYISSEDEDEYSSSRRNRRRRRRHRSSSSSESEYASESNRNRRLNNKKRKTANSRERLFTRDRQRIEQENRQLQQEKMRQIEERRVVYVGKIAEGTTRADLRKRFDVFGPILEISLHFRDRGDNYGFVAFRYKVDAYEAVEHGNDDPSFPHVDLCFGGRRSFCKEKYSDLDNVRGGENVCDENEDDGDFDSLLLQARAGIKK